MSNDPIPAELLQLKAVVYVRQSSRTQVLTNRESQRRQYGLIDVAKSHGFTNIEVIDDDLGRSASGTVDRPGFDRLVADVCAGKVGAVLCVDASRLARNGRDWHHLLELCGAVKARVIDMDGVYNPCRPSDRLLLGMKGSISEFELGILHARMLDAKHAKALRGELRFCVPVGYIWPRDADLGFDPDLRVQEAIRLIFSRFRQHGSARQVLLSLEKERMTFPYPYPTDSDLLTGRQWGPIRYKSVLAVLRNPFYAGAYAYGKSEKRTTLEDGRPRTTYKHIKSHEQWEVCIQGHHEGYIEWSEFERNRKILETNAYAMYGGVKSGRGGGALLSGAVLCGHCGRRLSVTYSGVTAQPVYRCDGPNQRVGRRRCLTVGAKRVDAAVAEQLLRALEPMAVEAALQAEKQHLDGKREQGRMVDLELQQASYEERLAQRRYAACDPDNRLIAAQLEKSWEMALQRVQACEARLAALQKPEKPRAAMPDLVGLAEDLQATWDAPGVTMRVRQQLLRALISEVVVNYNENSREILVTIHWRGGQHSQLCVLKPRSGETTCRTSEDAMAVIRSMATRWPDEEIAATLNRMGLSTGQGKTWTGGRVRSIRNLHEIAAYLSADKDGEWVTMTEAAAKLGVTNHQIRRLIKDGVLAATQVVPAAPFQIRASDLQDERVRAALAQRGLPRRAVSDKQTSILSDT
jgi:DNA invertase Pin-like site-specific DNA recombinase